MIRINHDIRTSPGSFLPGALISKLRRADAAVYDAQRTSELDRPKRSEDRAFETWQVKLPRPGVILCY